MNITFSKARAWASIIRKLFPHPSNSKICPELVAYIKTIDTYNAAQSNAEMLNAIRQYNHSVLDSLNRVRDLSGLRILDVGASPHGYALEKALLLGVSEYVGIGLDISETFTLHTYTGRARLLNMNAEALNFPDRAFDAIVTMSTFEHIGNLELALSEFYRVLRPNGCVLISFEPIWTCSYGHHLHHFGAISNLVPDWSHLLWSKPEMLAYLTTCWPSGAPLSVEEACDWIYEDNALNRIGIREIRSILTECQLQVEWVAPMVDDPRDEKQLTAAVEKLGLSPDELMTKGLSVLLYKR